MQLPSFRRKRDLLLQLEHWSGIVGVWSSARNNPGSKASAGGLGITTSGDAENASNIDPSFPWSEERGNESIVGSCTSAKRFWPTTMTIVTIVKNPIVGK